MCLWPHLTKPQSGCVIFCLWYRRQTPLREVVPSAPPDALDLMGKLLVFNPDKRLTAKEALQHSYVIRYMVISPQCQSSQTSVGSAMSIILHNQKFLTTNAKFNENMHFYSCYILNYFLLA